MKIKLCCLSMAVLVIAAACGQSKKAPKKRYPAVYPQIFDYKNVMIKIPGGEVVMGSKSAQEAKLVGGGARDLDFLDETPAHKVAVKPFYLDKYEVTVNAYHQFLQATGHKPPQGWGKIDLEAWANYPIVRVTWKDAATYAKWAGKRLPTEPEWELAARGTQGKRYPWGNTYHKEKAFYPSTGLFPTGTNPEDISPYGIMGMAGNVAEWTADDYKVYPGNFINIPDNHKVVRGGWFGAKSPEEDAYRSRGSQRSHEHPGITSLSIGFRCAMDIDNYKPPRTNKPNLSNMVLIAGGDSFIGTDLETAKKLPESYGIKKPQYENETPGHQARLEGYYIDRHEVTIGEYNKFLKDTGYFRTPKHWKKITAAGFLDSYPVAFIAWEDAAAYAQWSGKRLPTEKEWEKAARGKEGNLFPWGNQAAEEQLKSFKRKMAPVGTVKFDRSSYGVIDLGGNVSEWTADWYLPYKGNELPDSDYGHKFKVIKGGSNIQYGHYQIHRYTSRGAYRDIGLPFRKYQDVGFRCAYSKIFHKGPLFTPF